MSAITWVWGPQMEMHKPQCPINLAIDNYRHLKDRLESEANNADSKAMDAIDNQLVEEFDRILDLSPTNSAEAVKLVEFLLMALEDLTIGSTLPDQINEKILQIVAADFSG
ncbi:MAG: hypothetical protein AAGD96_24825 [Chloroflexota bacterium]